FEQLAIDAPVELLGERRLRPLTQEVGPSHAPGEERVPGEDEPRLRRPRPVGHDDRHTVGRVPGRVKERHTNVPHLVFLAIYDAHVWEVDVGRLMEEHRRAGGRGQGEELQPRGKEDSLVSAYAVRARVRTRARAGKEVIFPSGPGGGTH